MFSCFNVFIYIIMKSLLKFILKLISKTILWRHKPTIIAITGSAGKTSTRDAIFSVLSKKFSVRKSAKNYNNEIGVPLSIIGVDKKVSPLGYIGVILKGFYFCFWGARTFPKFLVLEVGTDKPGDIRYITSFVKPTIAVVTAIGEIPVHIEFFPERDALIKEKFSLLEALPKNGTAILNYDDLSVRGMRRQLTEETNALTYGFSAGAMVKADNFSISGLDNKEILEDSLRMNFKIDYNGSIVPVRVPGVLGHAQSYAVLAATTIALSMGMNIVEITEGLQDYESPVGRMNLLRGVKESWIIDDTYNSSPIALDSALDSLVKFDEYRRIAVLGDMMELGQHMEEAHRQVAKKAIGVCDIIIAVGERARFIYDEALSLGFDKDSIFYFDHHQLSEAGNALEMQLRKGDMVLVKGSQSMRMERIVKEVMREPLRAKELLVRQDWPDA